jgi:hypothetical protein
MIRNNKLSISTDIVLVTKSMAQEWLNNFNTNNRKATRHIVDKYADQMSRGQWVVNGDTICFDITGTLIDGQHRLLAVIKSEVPLRTTVVRNLPLDAFATIDDGSLRSAGDVIQRAGVKNSNAIAAIAKSLIAFQRGYGPHQQFQLRFISKTDISEFCEVNNDELQEAHRLTTLARTGCPIVGAAWGSLLFQVTKLYGPEIAEEFVDGTVNGGGTPNDPRNTVRKWVIRTRADASGQISAVIQLAHLTKAFNHWVAGKQLVKYIDWTVGKPFPRVGDPVSSGSRNLDV